jgi:hypothetical protein
VKPVNKPDDKQPFPIFGSLAEAEAYSDETGDAYFEICYHLEGNLVWDQSPISQLNNLPAHF